MRHTAKGALLLARDSDKYCTGWLDSIQSDSPLPPQNPNSCSPFSSASHRIYPPRRSRAPEQQASQHTQPNNHQTSNPLNRPNKTTKTAQAKQNKQTNGRTKHAKHAKHTKKHALRKTCGCLVRSPAARQPQQKPTPTNQRTLSATCRQTAASSRSSCLTPASRV